MDSQQPVATSTNKWHAHARRFAMINNILALFVLTMAVILVLLYVSAQ